MFMTIIPIMTSNTAPSGIVTASSYHASSYLPYKAFNGVVDTNTNSWFSLSGQAMPQWIQYQFPSTKYIGMYSITPGGLSFAPKAWQFQGSNDGNSWTTLDSRSNQTSWTFDRIFEISNPEYFIYYRLYITESNSATYVCVGELQMMPKPTIPLMTSDSMNGYITTRSSQYDASRNPYKAVDRSTTTNWYTQNNLAPPHWWKIQLPSAAVINSFYVEWIGNGYATSAKLQGSNNGTDWTDLYDYTGTGVLKEYKTFTNTTAYLYYRYYITATVNNTICSIVETQFFYIPPESVNDITLGNLYQESKTDDGLTLKLPFSDDDNEDCLVNVYYKLSTDAEYTLFGEFTRGEGMFTSIITGLQPGGEYDFKSVAVDDDGITGEATQYVLNQTLTYNQIKISNIKPTKTYNSITITADIEGDDNSDSSIQYRYRRSAVGNFEAGSWSAYIGPVEIINNQITFTITGLIKSTDYDIDINISDADGVNDATT